MIFIKNKTVLKRLLYTESIFDIEHFQIFHINIDSVYKDMG